MEYVEIIKSIIIAIAAFVTAFSALIGLNAWKKKLIGSRKIDATIKLFHGLNKLEKELVRARNPFFPASEIQEYFENVENPIYGKVNRQQPAHYARLQKVSLILIEIEEAEVELSAIMGENSIPELKYIYKKINELFTNVNLYYTDRYMKSQSTDDHMIMLKIIYSSGEDDEWKQDFLDLKKLIIEKYRKYIQ